MAHTPAEQRRSQSQWTRRLSDWIPLLVAVLVMPAWSLTGRLQAQGQYEIVGRKALENCDDLPVNSIGFSPTGDHFVAHGNIGAYAYDTASTNRLWGRFDCSSFEFLDAQHVLIGGLGFLEAVNLSTGASAWRCEVGPERSDNVIRITVSRDALAVAFVADNAVYLFQTAARRLTRVHDGPHAKFAFNDSGSLVIYDEMPSTQFAINDRKVIKRIVRERALRDIRRLVFLDDSRVFAVEQSCYAIYMAEDFKEISSNTVHGGVWRSYGIDESTAAIIELADRQSCWAVNMRTLEFSNHLVLEPNWIITSLDCCLQANMIVWGDDFGDLELIQLREIE